MKQALLFTVLFTTVIGIIISILNMIPIPEYKYYDCNVAEFHPDFPKEVKEECRKRRASKIIHT